MRKLASVIGLSVLGLACQQQEPAAAPLAAPAPAGTETAAAAPAATPAAPAAAKPAPLTPDQIVKNIQDCWGAYNAKDWTKFSACYAENATHEQVDSGVPPLTGRANIIEKANCTYCSYASGLIAYVREIAARTEQYWCPIKHADMIPEPHQRYHGFVEYGDASGYRESLPSLRRALRDESRTHDADSRPPASGTGASTAA